jgi:folate-binding protein YgfZ
MTSTENWQALLLSFPAPKTTLDKQSKLHICPLDYQAMFSISGPDSDKFLQGQLTCDIQEVIKNGSSIGAHCNPKGSILSTMRVIKQNNGYLLRTNSENFEQTLNGLNKYMMFSKASSTDISASRIGFGVFGEKASDFLMAEFDSCPLVDNQVIESNGTVIVKVPGERYEVWMEANKAKQWLSCTAVQEKLLSSSHWHKLDIINGIADIYPASSGDFIPQMCNLQAIGGVSFQKGCYTGQEIITRLHFRGKLNKQLVLATFQPSQHTLSIGQNIVNSDQKNVGKLLQSSCVENACYLQLIINHRDAEQALFLENGIELQPLSLPYSLDPKLFLRKD